MGKTPVEEYYTAQRVQTLITWRTRKQGKSLCEGFCKKHGTNKCPQQAELPKKGHCPEFHFKAQTSPEAQALLAADARRSGIDLHKDLFVVF